MESAVHPPQLSLWSFCRHSLFREYGWQFFLRFALPHPLRVFRAMRAATALDVTGDETALPAKDPEPPFGGPRAVVGVGFCLKPLDPPCPSGRFNHDCAFLEGLARFGAGKVPAPCCACVIREFGLLTLRIGAAFYIMTSARDILFDLYAPALAHRAFTTGWFVLCRYSLRPFAVGLLVAGIRGRMWPFESGDCRDYPTWLRADRGDKTERTGVSAINLRAIRESLLAAPPAPAGSAGYEKRGQVLIPLAPQTSSASVAP